MIRLFFSFVFAIFGSYIFPVSYSFLSFGIFAFFVFNVFWRSNVIFVFREFCLLLYSINYLISPTISYSRAGKISMLFDSYAMKISAESYFPIAILGILSFSIGMYIKDYRIFKPSLLKIKMQSKGNEELLKYFVYFGLLFSITGQFIPSSLKFIFYFLSLFKFVGSFSLYALDSKIYLKWPVGVLLFEVYRGFIFAMFHDAVMWLIFFALFFIYLVKPSHFKKILGLAIFVVIILFIQNFKGAYRQKTWDGGGESNLSEILNTSFEVYSEVGNESNLNSTLNRANQAWILASTVERMDRVQDYQGLHIFWIYFESAILPRFFAPNKIKSGDKSIFNKFSGHYLSNGTSMGLGVFSDGYVAFGQWGVVLFGLGLGLLFNFTFYVIQKWMQYSEFYFLLLLPLLNYAIRPDCELQTILNHLSKGLFLSYGVLVVSKYQFTVFSVSKSKKL